MRSSVATLVCVLGLVALAVSIPILPVSHEEPAHHVEVEHEEEPALDHLDVDAPRFEEDEDASEEVKQPAHVAAAAQPVEDEEDQEDQEDEQEDERQAAAHERFMEEHLTNSTAGNSSNPANHTAPVNSTKAPTPVRVTAAPTVAPSTVRPSVTNAPSPQVGLQQTVTDQAVQTTGLSTALPTDACWKWTVFNSTSKKHDGREEVFSFSADGKSVSLFGGCAQGIHMANCAKTLSTYNSITRSWDEQAITVPDVEYIKSTGAARCYSSSSGRVWDFGGSRKNANTNWLAALFLDQATGQWTWQKQSTTGTIPPVLQDATLTCYKNYLILFGGFNDQSFYNDVYYVATSGANAFKWHKLTGMITQGTAPAARGGHTATRSGRRIFVLGGTDGTNLYADLHVLTIPDKPEQDVWKWEPVATKGAFAPSGRTYHTSVLLGNRLIVMGGVNPAKKKYYSDISVLDLTTFAWMAAPSTITEGAAPVAFRKASATVTGTAVIVFGGTNSLGSLDVFTPRMLDTAAVCSTSCGSHGKYVQYKLPKYAECKCDTQWTGKFCTIAAECPNKCSGRGNCTSGVCKCKLGFGGVDCSTPVCPNNCGGSARGSCDQSSKRCVCKPGYWGLDCKENNCPSNCLGRGICQLRDASGTNKCKCLKGFSGPGCEYWAAPKPASTNKSSSSFLQLPSFLEEVAVEDNDLADALDDTDLLNLHDYEDEEDDVASFLEEAVYLASTNGTNKSTAPAPAPAATPAPTAVREVYNSGFSCPNHCSGHGICKKVVDASFQVTGKCTCVEGFAGADCAGECALHCSGPLAGTCVGSNPATVKCQCNLGYRSFGCFQRYCANNCSGHGVCSGSQCLCRDPWSGAACEADTSCSNHGSFVGNKCQCKAGWGGPSCSVAVTCKVKDCSGHGVCTGVTQPGTNKIVGQCKCNDGWTGVNCTKRACPKQCSGNGICKDSGKCSCYSGYAGAGCERMLRCPNNCTKDHGRCAPDSRYPGSSKGVCQCTPQWSGPSCSDVGCPSQCSKRGKCMAGKCQCDAGYSGPACELECPDRCAGKGICVGGTCQCHAGFSGLNCNATATCPGHSDPRGECLGRGACFKAAGTCECQPGYDGVDCSRHFACGVQGCGQHGTCRNSQCYCDPGWSGDHCEVQKSCENDCNQHGVCHNGKCHCHSGFAGEFCEKFTVDASCPNGCSNNGVCEYGRCICASGHTGPDCSQIQGRSCFKTASSKFPCEGRGDCRFGKCWCNPGFAGKFCEAREKCIAGCTPGQGTCIRNKCHCKPGFTGMDCSEELACGGQPTTCSGHGVCIQGNCACLPGFTGGTCEKGSKVTNSTSCPKKCSNNGVCHEGRCFCVKGYSGKDCSMLTQQSCPNGCSDNGVCRYGKCFCKPGFTGRACNKQRKCSAGCLRNGVCAYGKCYCVKGWTGPDCDIPEHLHKDATQVLRDVKDLATISKSLAVHKNDTSFCVGGCGSAGLCVNNTCHCVGPYYGAHCQLIRQGVVAGRCGSGCNGHGRCHLGKCVCHVGYFGPTCAKKQEWHCPKNCSSHGVCHYGVCLCHPAYEGFDCSKRAACPVGCWESGHGVCFKGTCKCVKGYSGSNCSTTITSTSVAAVGAPAVGAAAKFREILPEPMVDERTGPSFGNSKCSQNCGVNGMCVNSECYCKPGFSGAACDKAVVKRPLALGDVTAHAALSGTAHPTSYWLLAGMSFGSGLLAVLAGQALWTKHKERQRKHNTKQLLRPLLHSIDT